MRLFFFVIFALSSVVLKSQAPLPARYNLKDYNKELIEDYLKESNYIKHLERLGMEYYVTYSLSKKRHVDYDKRDAVIEKIIDKDFRDFVILTFSSIPEENLKAITAIYKKSKGKIDTYDEFILINSSVLETLYH